MAEPTITPLGYAMGAEVTGLDLRRPIDDLTRRRLYEAWLKHVVLVFPGQALTPQQHIAFSANFGTLDDHASQAPETLLENEPQILVVTNKHRLGKPSGTRNTGRNWHTDLSYSLRPAKGALLLCQEKPPVGGDTMWANLTMAYETLSPTMQRFIEGLEAVHDVSLVKGIGQRDPAVIQGLRSRNPPVVHPMVRVHPDTGRKSLLAGERVSHILGLTEDESTALLNFLNAHATSPEFVYRHRWRVGDIVLWDNRCTCHVALPDFDQSQPRLMLRCSLQGEAVGRLAEAAPAATKEQMIQTVAALS
ncbi:taurine dioxygenase [Siccirubricoccus deserti]|uniref:TauD/TfdA family dioxygenase n=1 Tax=Siccirubricoccus deserti TaxID=2013562 RepID=A0A9X0R3S8_9PROT|nr:TauD/TfdA family dioxygenase [Siccirubricoccus deserti]MBC4018904.1 TauD/TfdA family dioxygenase [Siccirubricoccus deserti]GGC69451.1 taurine dioxygenase [Siccirubricoccus deserti]